MKDLIKKIINMKNYLIIGGIVVLVIVGGIYLINEFKLANLSNKMVTFLEKLDYTCEKDGSEYGKCIREEDGAKREIKVDSNLKTLYFKVYDGDLEYEIDTSLYSVYLREDGLGACSFIGSSANSMLDMQKIKFNEKLKMAPDFIGVNEIFPCYKYLPKANDYLAEFYDIVNYFEEIQ